MGRPPVCPLLSHLLGGAGHRVVSHNGDPHQGTESYDTSIMLPPSVMNLKTQITSVLRITENLMVDLWPFKGYKVSKQELLTALT